LPVDRTLPERLAVLAALKLETEIAERIARVRAALPMTTRARGRADPFLAAEVRFLDLAVRAFQPLWPAPAAEAGLRAEICGRRIDDKQVLVRSLAGSALVPVWLGRASRDQIDRAHENLDAADELARAHDVPFGREIVQMNRSIIWIGTDMTRARRTCEAALEGFARRGMADAYDGVVARMYYLYILGLKGDYDDAFAAVDRELAVERPNFINVGLSLDHKVMMLSRHGRCAEAREAYDRLVEHVASLPVSRFDVVRERSKATVLLAEGRAQEAPWERAAKASGAWGVGLDRTLWLEVGLEASLSLLGRGKLTKPQRARARADAEWLTRRGVFVFASLGHRALGLLD